MRRVPGEKPTLYLHAALSPDLVQAHGAHVALARAGGLSCDPLYTPGSIVFHCTLAVEIEEADLLIGTGVEMCRMHPETLEGRAATVELVESFPRGESERGRSGPRSGGRGFDRSPPVVRVEAATRPSYIQTGGGIE